MPFYYSSILNKSDPNQKVFKVTPHDESPFQENARRALLFKVSPLKFGIHNDKSLLL
jgi:hypothetical protein